MMSRRLTAPLLALLGVGCGVAVEPLEGFDVVVSPTEDCTLTGATTRDCVDAALLAQRRTKGRWIFEHSKDEAFALTTEEGATLAGITFLDDGVVLNEPPCIGAGGLCYFARRRFESTDEGNNGCTVFGETVVILLRLEDGTFSGILSDTQGTDQDCGTSTVVQRRHSVTGVLVQEPSPPRADAARGT
jgi:hypothetical protein